MGLPRRRRLEGAGLPRYRGDDRPRPQPPVDHHLGRPAQRDPQRHRVLHQHERARARPGRLAADGRRDGGPAPDQGLPAGRVRRGRLLLGEGPGRREGARAAAAGDRGGQAVHGQRGRRHPVRAGHLLPPHRSPGRPAGAGDGARAGARHRRLGRPVLRAARLDRIRLPVRQRQPVPGREVHRRGRPVPDPQARRRHLPGADRPAGPAGDRAGVLLGLRPVRPR